VAASHTRLREDQRLASLPSALATECRTVDPGASATLTRAAEAMALSYGNARLSTDP
jgi:hypothetical protein